LQPEQSGEDAEDAVNDPNAAPDGEANNDWAAGWASGADAAGQESTAAQPSFGAKDWNFGNTENSGGFDFGLSNSDAPTAGDGTLGADDSNMPAFSFEGNNNDGSEEVQDIPPWATSSSGTSGQAGNVSASDMHDEDKDDDDDEVGNDEDEEDDEQEERGESPESIEAAANSGWEVNPEEEGDASAAASEDMIGEEPETDGNDLDKSPSDIDEEVEDDEDEDEDEHDELMRAPPSRLSRHRQKSNTASDHQIPARSPNNDVEPKT